MAVTSDYEDIFKTHFLRRFKKAQVKTDWQTVPANLPGGVAAAMEKHWQENIQATGKGDHIYNGNLCRLQDWQVAGDQLRLRLRPTSYKHLLYSNGHCEDIRKRFGTAALSRALGISLLLISADNRLIVIRRSHQVGESPGKLDVIGGHVTPDEHLVQGKPDVFFAIADELQEETGLRIRDTENITITGLLETTSNCKPELIFHYPGSLTAQEIIAAGEQQRAPEIAAFMSVENQQAVLMDFLRERRDAISPSAFGAIWMLAHMNPSP